MQSKKNILLLLLLSAISIASCSKHNDDTGTMPPASPPPVSTDTLGAGWQAIKVDTLNDLEDIFFVNNQLGFLCGPSYIGKSVDGGLNWVKILPDSLRDNFVNIFFLDANNGWVFGGQHFSLRTRDGGSSWQKIVVNGLFDGQFFDANNGFITSSGTSPGLNKTSDGGTTLQNIAGSAAGGACRGLFFLNPTQGWFTNSLLNKTTDGGSSLVTPAPKITMPDYVIQFTDALHGWIGGFFNIYRTTDGGATLQTLITSAYTTSFYFFDNNNGYVIANNKIYTTTDGGTTLSQVCSIHKDSELYKLHFTDASHGWTTGLGGYIYKYVKP